MQNFSKRLKQSRQNKQLTQKALAEELGMLVNSYQKYELAKREPNLETLVAICNLLEVSADYLLGRTDNPKVNK